MDTMTGNESAFVLDGNAAATSLSTAEPAHRLRLAQGAS
jgi:hypothetical protein